MQRITGTPQASLIAGLAIGAGVLLLFLATAGTDAFGFFSFLIRLLHVLAAMLWVGLIVFVNFVQLVALQAANDQERGFLHQAVVPRVAWWFRHASTVVVATGAI